MTAPRTALLGLALALVGCGGSRIAAGAAGPLFERSFETLVSGLATPGDETAESPRRGACEDALGPYAGGMGVRGLTCLALYQFPLETVVQQTGARPFLSGPHAPGPEGLGLDLLSRSFGHYDPAFVASFASAAAAPRDAAVRGLAQRLYDDRVQRLARVYWLVHADLARSGFPRATPPGAASDYVRYLRGGPLGVGADDVYPGFSMMVFFDRNEPVPAALGIDRDDTFQWFPTVYEANTATGFWLRRREDGSLNAFRDGLRGLLASYDADWLRAHPGA